MTEFQVAPFDQHLSLNGYELSDVHSTLGSLGILPDCRLTLKVRYCYFLVFTFLRVFEDKSDIN